jgi:hypothetical protein
MAAPALAADGAGESPWGPIADPADSIQVAMDEARRPAWETVVDVPFYIVMFPLILVMGGVEYGAEYLDESGIIARASALYPLKVGRAYLTGGISGGGADGIGASLNLDFPEFPGEDNHMRVGGSMFTRGKGSATFGLKVHRTPDSWVQFGGGYRADSNARYYGVGAGSDKNRESFYLEEVFWGGLSYARRIGDGFTWEGSVTYSGAGAIGSENSERPHLSEEFADELPFGYRDRSDGFSLALELSHDNTFVKGPGGLRPERGRPERGGLRRAKVAYFQEKGNGDSQFWTYRGELQQFVPLWFDRRALALRGVVAYLDEAGGDEVIAFQRLLTNDDPDLLRGYKDDRFRDRGLVVASAEYRWPLWSQGSRNGIGVDTYAFVDYGQVFGEFDDINSRDLTTSYGAGLRVAGFGMFMGRLEFAWSEEDFLIRLRGDQIFQFERGGLLNGQVPVPER